jgi:bisphosphoglycerate-dependent phosphoglycerate mutase
VPHYLVAYAHTVRCEKAATKQEATRMAFGVDYDNRVTVLECPRLPRNMTRAKLTELQEQLAVSHFRRTGSILQGYEKLPSIANVHWTQCQLCRRSILTEPKSAGIDDVLCQECQPKYDTLTEQEREELSTAQVRKKLFIVPR